MVDFKINRGYKDNLPAAYTDGYIYFCVDTGEIFIDYLDENDNVQRKQINADEANRLVDYDIVNAIDDVGTTVEIPTTEAVVTKFSDRIVASDATGELTNVLPDMFGGRTADEYALKSDLENVSWNDLTDRPFYSEINTVEILPECQPQWDANSESFVLFDNYPIFVVGNTYVVNYNGVEYRCIAHEVRNAPCLGDTSTMTGSTSTGEPFIIASVEGKGLLVMPLDSASSVTLSVMELNETIKTIDEKYLPSMSAQAIDIFLDTQTASISFEEAFAMSAAELQAAITVYSDAQDKDEGFGGYSITWVRKQSTGSDGGNNICFAYRSCLLSSIYAEERVWRWNGNGLIERDPYPSSFKLKSSSGKKFTITVSDDGVLSATAIT